jgi:hypothetical protein
MFMNGRALILLTLFVLLALAVIGCNTGGSTEDLESTIVARFDNEAGVEGCEPLDKKEVSSSGTFTGDPCSEWLEFCDGSVHPWRMLI